MDMTMATLFRMLTVKTTGINHVIIAFKRFFINN